MPFQIAVLTGKVIPMGGKTPWIMIGPWPIMILLLVGLILSWRFKNN